MKTRINKCLLLLLLFSASCSFKNIKNSKNAIPTFDTEDLTKENRGGGASELPIELTVIEEKESAISSSSIESIPEVSELIPDSTVDESANVDNEFSVEVPNTDAITNFSVQLMDIIFYGFNTYAAYVLPYGDGVRIWYHGQQTKPKRAAKDKIYTRYGQVNGASSSWTDYAAILSPGDIPGANAEHVGDPTISIVVDPITKQSTFVMFFTVCANGCKSINDDNQIWSALSLDGVRWSDFKYVIGGAQSPGGLTGPYAAEPFVFLDSSLSSDQMWMLYYPDPNTYSINAIPVDKNRNVMRSVGNKTFPVIVYKDATYVSAVEVHKFSNRYYLTATRNSVKSTWIPGSSDYPYSHFDMIVAESNDPLDFGINTARPLMSFAEDPINCGALAPTIHKLSETVFDVYFTLLSRLGGDCLLYDDRTASRPMLRWRFQLNRVD